MDEPSPLNAQEARPLIRALACVRGDARPLIRAALGKDFDLTFCDTLHEAQVFLDESFNLILCALNFDDSRMFEMLELARRHDIARHALFVCLKASPTILSERFFESVKKAALALGADDFIEFYRWQDDYGEGLALQMLRRHLIDLALPQGGA